MSTDAIRIDDSAWPVVVIEIFRAPSNEEVERFVAALESLAGERKRPFSVLLDTRRKVKVTPAQRKLIGAGFKRGAIAEHARAEAVLLHSSLLATFGRVMLAVLRPKFQMGAFADYDRAFAWARTQAERPPSTP